ncbi:MAG: SEC-C metal-binding domain-containing protein [Pseudomonadota bacterium]
MINAIRASYCPHIAPVLSRAAEQRQHGASADSIERVGRNALCPCGSGRKFKKCCGKDQGEE